MLSQPKDFSATNRTHNTHRPTIAGVSVSQKEVDKVVALFHSGKTTEALKKARLLAERAPDLVPLLDLQGACLRSQGNLAGALGFYKRSLDIGGSTAVGHFNLGITFYDLFNLDMASTHLSKAAALDPDNAQMAQTLALSLNAQGRHLEAVQVLSAQLQNNRVSDELLNALGHSLRNIGRLAEAKACHKAVTGTTQAGAEAQYQLGIIAAAEGNKETAQLHFLSALELDPKLTPAHRSLSTVLRYDIDHPHLKAMQLLLEQSDLSTAAEIELRFALFKALNDAKQHDAAFEHLNRGNSLKHQMIRYSLQNDANLFAHLQHTFDRPAPVASSEISFRPIFIVGLPRSGTTLTERILCGSKGVTGAGELPYATTAMSNLLKQMQAEGQTEFTQAHAQSLRQALSQAMQGHANGAPVVIDKMPLNFRWLGGLLTAFPEARVVYTTRPPRDMFWSLFKVCLQGAGNGFIYDADDIVQYQALTHGLMQHWMQLFPGQIHQLDHDKLTQSPEEHIRTLVDFCDLEWSPECMHPENREAAIQTASSQQARKPIYHNATPDWQPYEAYLASAFDRLAQLDL